MKYLDFHLKENLIRQTSFAQKALWLKKVILSQAARNYQSEIALSYYIHIAELIESVSVSRPWLYGLDSFTVMSSHLKSLFHDIEHLLGRFSPFGSTLG